MACTQQQCDELEALIVVLQANLIEIEAVLSVKNAEKTSTEDAIELAYMCLWDCECEQAAAITSGVPRSTKELTPEMRARINTLLAVSRMVRANPPAATSPRQT